MQLIKNLSIKLKLFILYSFVFVLILTISFSLLFFQIKWNLEDRIRQELNQSNKTISDMVETAATVSIKNHLKAIAEKNKEISAHFFNQFQDGQITESDAKVKAVKILLSQTVGDTGYLYCINSRGVAVVHPQTGVIGKDFSYRKFIQKQISKKEGYLEYQWKNPDETQERSKALYMSYFDSWDWIISASSYKSEFINLININDFKDRISSLTFGETGYSFILNSQGDIVIHPELSGNVIDLKGAKGFPIAREMVRLKKGYLTYWWQNPSETHPKEKFIAFDYIPAFDWIVVSSSYTKEVFSSLYEIQKAFLVILALVFLVTGGVTLFVSTTITKPLLEFIRQIENRHPDDWSSRLDHKRKDEIGKLSASFNRFMDRLESYRQKLVSEIRVRKKAEQRHGLLAEVIEQSHQPILITDQEGCVQYANQAFESNTGYSKDEIMGKDLIHYITDRQQEGLYRDIWKTLKSGKVWSGHLTNERKNGNIKEEDATILPVKKPDGKIVNYAAIMRDLTQEKNLERILLQAQKMESVGRLAGGVAHDFNNMLGVILGHTELALLQADEHHELHGDLKEIQKAAKRSADITKQLLAFARKQVISPRQLDLNDTVESMLNMLRRLIGEDIDLVWKPAAHPWTVKMDPSQIDQILVNLCINGRDAITGVGKLTIETGKKSFNEEYCCEHPGFIPGDFVLLAVSDNGCGMDKEILDNLFEPFFTTKDVGKGTGLGLATIFGIVKQNNGFINVYSEPGQGSTFKIYLPRFAADKDTEKAVPDKKAAAGETETILLVEDEPSILRMTRMMLEKKGYTVLSAATPTEAMEKAKNHSGSIDLLMTDVIMPEMNGRDLADQITALYPGIRLLFMSGYTANIIAHHGVLDDEVSFIQKPFSMVDLAEKLWEVLDSASDKN
ncbi:MAG: cache domain-containing protein [Desulfotignum sp.]|nr:cache domain-containing protein [Desulfotignum sp.]MCF8137036.1 cache domain-containing protein [Desulfotignum sp.]